ncbi:hypothetical protein SAMN04487968_1017 [Nocardioides terrae]|uniref:Uncharacterized protein n=1 Tax=Nocardioides terrae TaxID=574651 RepID=A0A1I1D4L7_9ACTN|nr:hypothetical protein [Nocardioides terrae]SFB69737.1 hypothetical protein SAMN04487968_1017 [Nocardioides terrae]
MSIFRRRSATVGSGERVLASAPVMGSDDVVAATREALYVAGRRLPWEQVHDAGWDSESSLLTVTENDRTVHRIAVDAPARLLQLVRERVTASVVVQRAVPLPFGTARVVARRAGGGAREITWVVEYDDLADPDDPAVAALVQATLERAQDDVGEP